MTNTPEFCENCGNQLNPVSKFCESCARQVLETPSSESESKLSKPNQPQVFSLAFWLVLLLIPVVNIISIFCAPLLKGLKIFMSAAATIFIGFIIWYAALKHEDPFSAKDMTMMVGFVVFLLYIICLIYSWYVAKARLKDKSDKRLS
ncbi:MAG: zinc ribbon domain-containing protein [Candidatus Omnitrophica bacterium]|nr:zinc ribbon domain-containing protein [Candidatus Omnitrophota bacterium]